MPGPRLRPKASLATPTGRTLVAKHARNKAAWTRNALNTTFLAIHATVTASAIALEAASTPTTGTLPLSDFVNEGADILYFGQISLGTPAQVNNLQYDTGSGDPWTTYYKVSVPAVGQIGYDPAKSSTVQVSSTPFDDKYEKGEANGTLVQDVMAFAGWQYSRPFGVSTIADATNAANPLDGIFPLGTSLLSSQGYTTPFEDLINANAVAQPYFGLALARGSGSVTSMSPTVVAGGQLCLGCIPSAPAGTVAQGSVFWAKVIELAYWTISTDGISIGGKLISGTRFAAIIDSGTSLIYLPTAYAQALAAALSGTLNSDGSITVPVASITTSTVLGFSFSGTTFTMSPVDLILGYGDSSQTTYVLSILAQDLTTFGGQPAALIGDAFLKNVISVYSYSTDGVPSVGFIQLGTSSAGGSPSSAISSAIPSASVSDVLGSSAAPVPPISSVASTSRAAASSSPVISLSVASTSAASATPMSIGSSSGASASSTSASASATSKSAARKQTPIAVGRNLAVAAVWLVIPLLGALLH